MEAMGQLGYLGRMLGW